MLGQDAIGDLALGQPAGFNDTTPAVAGAFTVAGSNATLSHIYPINAAAGAYTLSPKTVTFTYIRNLTLLAGAGSYVVGAQTAGLLWKHQLNGTARSYVLNAFAAGLTQVLGATPATYTLGAQTVTFGRVSKLFPAPGSYALGPKTATLLQVHKLFPAAGAISISGSATMVFTRAAQAAPAAFALTGKPVTLLWNHLLTAPQMRAVSQYVITGQPTLLLEIVTPLRTLSPDVGRYQLFPHSANYTSNGVFAPKSIDKPVGAFTVAGSNAPLLASRILAASSGSFAVASVGATFKRVHDLFTASGSYMLTANLAATLDTHKLSAAPGAFVLGAGTVRSYFAPLKGLGALYSVTGAASLLKKSVLQTGTGAYSIRSVNRLDGAPGAFRVSAPPATIAHARPFNTTAGAYTVAAPLGTLVYRASLNPGAGSLRISGNPATLKFTRDIGAVSRALTVTGSATLTYRRTLLTQTGTIALSGFAADRTVFNRILAAAPGALHVNSPGITFIEAEGVIVPDIAHIGWPEFEWSV